MPRELGLQEAIYKAGFDAYAIMQSRPVARMLPILREAQAEYRYPEFADGDIAKRLDPQTLQPSSRSIISLALSYHTGAPGPTPAAHGTISRAAWGMDYHRVMDKRMDKVISYLKEECGAKECSKAVDTTFLVDRALAIEAGLGYPGANCAVYVPPFGSWVFLGEILVDISLPVTSNSSGEHWSCPEGCNRCVRACPTGALMAPGKIRPQICISYLTQMSGPIPLELRSKIGSKLWGCDICQQVCPTNQKAKLSPHPEFQPLIGPHLNLIPLLSLTKGEFRETFGRTSIAWRGKNVLARNACIILGNQYQIDALPILEKTAQEHPSAIVQDAAAWAVEKIRSD